MRGMEKGQEETWRVRRGGGWWIEMEGDERIGVERSGRCPGGVGLKGNDVREAAGRGRRRRGLIGRERGGNG